MRESAGTKRLGHRQVGVREVDVLTDDRDLDFFARLVHTAQQIAPHGPVDIAERKPQSANDIRVQAFPVQNPRDVVDRGRVRGRNASVDIDVTHERDLGFQRFRNLAVAAQDQRIRLDTDAAKRGNRVLRRLRLQFTRRCQDTARGKRAGKRHCPGRHRDEPAEQPRGTAAIRCRRRCHRSR